VDAALVFGCAAAGAATGLVTDLLAARIPPAKRLAPVASDVASLSAPPQSDPPPPPPPPPPTEVQTVPEVASPMPSPHASEIAASVLVGGAAFALAAYRLGAVSELAAYCVLFGGLVAMSITDIRVALVPRRFLYPTLVLTAAALVASSSVDHRWRALADAGIGGAASFAVFFGVWWFFPKGMGLGDVRLAGLIGGAVGWLGLGRVYVGFMAAFVLALVYGSVLMVHRGTGRKTRLPFAPALALGGAFAVLWGGWALRVWLHQS